MAMGRSVHSYAYSSFQIYQSAGRRLWWWSDPFRANEKRDQMDGRGWIWVRCQGHATRNKDNWAIISLNGCSSLRVKGFRALHYHAFFILPFKMSPQCCTSRFWSPYFY